MLKSFSHLYNCFLLVLGVLLVCAPELAQAGEPVDHPVPVLRIYPKHSSGQTPAQYQQISARDHAEADLTELGPKGDMPTIAIYMSQEAAESAQEEEDRLSQFEDDSDVAEVADPQGQYQTGPTPVVALYMSMAANETEEEDRLEEFEDDTDVAEVADPEGLYDTLPTPMVAVYLSVASDEQGSEWNQDEGYADFEDEADDSDVLYQAQDRPVVSVYMSVSEQEQEPIVEEDRLSQFEDDSDVAEVADPEGLRDYLTDPKVAVYVAQSKQGALLPRRNGQHRSGAPLVLVIHGAPNSGKYTVTISK